MTVMKSMARTTGGMTERNLVKDTFSRRNLLAGATAAGVFNLVPGERTVNYILRGDVSWRFSVSSNPGSVMMASSKRSAEKEAFWRSMLKQQWQGDLNIRAFCRKKGISEPSFYAWRAVLRKRDGERDTDAGGGRVAANGGGRLVPVKILDSMMDAGGQADRQREIGLPVEISTPSGFTLRFGCDTTPDTVARLLEVIDRHPIRTEQPSEGGASC